MRPTAATPSHSSPWTPLRSARLGPGRGPRIVVTEMPAADVESVSARWRCVEISFITHPRLCNHGMRPGWASFIGKVAGHLAFSGHGGEHRLPGAAQVLRVGAPRMKSAPWRRQYGTQRAPRQPDALGPGLRRRGYR